jgi:hypothetical protein
LRVSSEEHHVALPKLFGAPAYARPARPLEAVERPVDPDDLPLELERTADEIELAARMTGSAFAPVLTAKPGGGKRSGQLQGRPFRLRVLTGKLFRNS